MYHLDNAIQAKLRELRLSIFAEIFFELVATEEYAKALPEDIFIEAANILAQRRRERNIAKAIAQAKFRYPHATLEEITNPEQRGIDTRQLARIAKTDWRKNPTNLHLLAPAGTGKTYIACAIGIAACQAGYSVMYYRLDQLVTKLAAFLPTDPAYSEEMRKITNVDVLIIDDFLTLEIDSRGQDDLTKIIFDREGRLPTIISSQSAAGYWLKTLPNRVGADSLVSRLSSGRHIEIGDFDMRQHLATIQDNTDT
ncbi:ATP-binding protein [Trueperella abortisuis]|uniref:DNA replication protein DnaC n=1 Tax=Trueperella abortisuis TaxID=445930 RepID=A0ABT9PJI4_9ACTO|nr:ATP-binding protein [Trueperella abortisuis]MDP9832886.1 DNA replication protein DnaC [Trueperella abortisuis]